MTAIIVGKNRLKIKLDPFEADELFCEFDSVSFKNPKIRHTLQALLKKAIYQTNFIPDCERMKVELFPAANGGFIIYFTKTQTIKKYRRKTNKKYRLILSFRDSNNAIDISKALTHNSFSAEKSSFFKLNEKYYLIITVNSGRLFYSPVIKEFADSLQCSETAAAIVSEYGKKLICDNAIEKLSSI